MDGRAILELVENAARLARAGKPRKARAPGADAPGRDRDREGGDFYRDRRDIDAAALQTPAKRAIVVGQSGRALGVFLADQRLRDAIGHGPSDGRRALSG